MDSPDDLVRVQLEYFQHDATIEELQRLFPFLFCQKCRILLKKVLDWEVEPPQQGMLPIKGPAIYRCSKCGTYKLLRSRPKGLLTDAD